MAAPTSDDHRRSIEERSGKRSNYDGKDDKGEDSTYVVEDFPAVDHSRDAQGADQRLTDICNEPTDGSGNWHTHLELGEHVSGKNRENQGPPRPDWSQQQAGEEDCIGRPEGRNRLSARGPSEANSRAEIVARPYYQSRTEFVLDADLRRR